MLLKPMLQFVQLAFLDRTGAPPGSDSFPLYPIAGPGFGALRLIASINLVLPSTDVRHRPVM